MAPISGGGMSQFYSQMPDNFTIAVNGNNPIVIDILADVEKSYGDKLKTITKKIDAAVAEERRFDEVVKGKKEEELTPEEKSTREELSKKINTLRDERDTRLREIGGENKLVKQIIDLALLSNGLLKGKNLTSSSNAVFRYREIAVNYRISRSGGPEKGAAAILYRIKSYGTLIRIPPSTKIRNIFLLGKIDTINRRFVKNSVNYRFFSNSSINPPEPDRDAAYRGG